MSHYGQEPKTTYFFIIFINKVSETPKFIWMSKPVIIKKIGMTNILCLLMLLIFICSARRLEPKHNDIVGTALTMVGQVMVGVGKTLNGQ